MCTSDKNRTSNHHNLHNCDHEKYDCSHGRMQRFIEPCLLLLLTQNPTYGYDLIDKLSKFGFESPDPGTIYRYLRKLEEKEMVTSKWNTESSGPAKRSYRVTKEGREYLEAWVVRIEKNKGILNRFLDEYRSIEE